MPSGVSELHSGAALTCRFFKSLRLGFSVGDTHEEKAAYASGQRRTFPGMKFIGEADEARAAELFNHEWQTLAPIAQRVLETVISAVQGNCRFIETGVADDALAIHHCVGKDTSGTTAAVHGFSQQERATELNEKTLPTAHAMVLQVGEDGNPVSSPENDITSTVGRVLRDVYERERRGSLEKCVTACMYVRHVCFVTQVQQACHNHTQSEREAQYKNDECATWTCTCSTQHTFTVSVLFFRRKGIAHSSIASSKTQTVLNIFNLPVRLLPDLNRGVTSAAKILQTFQR